MDERRLMNLILRLLDLTHEVHNRIASKVKKQVGITLEQAIVLCELDLANGKLRSSDLAKVVGRLRHTATSRVNGLAKMGLVTRQPESTGDRRTVWVTITDAGMEKLEIFRDAKLPLVKSLTGNISERVVQQQLERTIGALSNLFTESKTR